MSCVNSTGTADHHTARFEHDLEGATPIPVTKKPFDAITEGLIRKNSRGDRTALELFVSAVQAWPDVIRRLLAAA
jgi:hypothetical protein